MAMKVGELYLETVRNHFVKRGNWELGEEIELGDYGRLLKVKKLGGEKFFKRRGNIREQFDIEFEIRKDPISNITRFCSKGGYEFQPGGSGKVAEVGKVGGRLNFTHNETVFIDARECYYDSIRSIDDVGDRIIEEYEKGKWKRDFLFVTQIMRSKGATVIITTGDNSSLDLEAEIDVPLSIDLISDPSIGLTVTKQSKVGLQIMGEKDLVLMMETYRVYDSFLNTKVDPDIKGLKPKKEREIKIVKVLD